MGIKLTQYEKDLIKKNKQYIIDGDWDGFFNDMETYDDFGEFKTTNIFQFCLECVPDLLYKITKLPYYAYAGSDIKSINLPNNIKDIRDFAFYSCRHLEQIKFPDNLKYIGFDVFCFCDNLKKLYIPDSVTEIGWSAFAYCDRLKYISIPKHLEKNIRVDCSECLSEDCEIEVRS